MNTSLVILTAILAGGTILPMIATAVPYRHQNKVHLAALVYVGLGLIGYFAVSVASASALVTL